MILISTILKFSAQDTTPLALNATQGHKPIFSTSYISIPNYGDDPTGTQA